MAEIQQTETGKKPRAGVRRSKKLSTRIDLTPMVDLGFLLITFFVFTTSISKPMSMDITVPDDKSIDSSKVPERKTISLILAANNTVFYYNGKDINNMHSTNYSAAGLRQVIMNKRQQVKKDFGNPDQTIVLIKPADSSSYNNVVAVFDEMRINEIKSYILMDLSPEEKKIAVQKN